MCVCVCVYVCDICVYQYLDVCVSITLSVIQFLCLYESSSTVSIKLRNTVTLDVVMIYERSTQPIVSKNEMNFESV